MPLWIRVWAATPVARGTLRDWLWDHGGFDVEGPAAVAQREDRDEFHRRAHEACIAALDGAGSWPSVVEARTQSFEVVDVDRYADCALVVVAIDRDVERGRPMLAQHLYEVRDGERRYRGGGASGGSGDPLFDRLQYPAEAEPVMVRARGWSGGVDVHRKGIYRAVVLCSPLVARVDVERPGDVRNADVTGGPGWVGIVWPAGKTPTVRAFDVAGAEIGELCIDESNFPSTRGSRRRRRRRLLTRAELRRKRSSRWTERSTRVR